RAAALAKHDYLIFLDGDCIPFPDFVTCHAKLAEKGWFIAGNRVLLKADFTKQVLENKLEIQHWNLSKWFGAYLSKKCNRFESLCRLPLGGVRKAFPARWQGAKTCNLGVWRQDFVQVNGLDEDFIGWGFEDSDLVIRLQR